MTDHLIQVRMSEYAASGSEAVSLQTTSLGSCVAVALYDSVAHIGGLCHCLLDRQTRCGPASSPGRCVDSAIPALVQEMVNLGALRERLTAWMAGGGNMFGTPNPVYDVGQWNIDAAKGTLAALGIPVMAQHVGGSVSRRLRIDVATGSVSVVRPDGVTEVL